MDGEARIQEHLLEELRELRAQIRAYQEQLLKEHQQTAESLRENEEQYKDLFEHANDLMQFVAPDGHFLYVNRAWRDTLGYTEGEIASLTFEDILAPESAGHCLHVFQQVMSGEHVNKVNAVFLSKDGREIAVEGNLNCKRVNGLPVSTRAIFRNITGRQQSEEALRQSEEQYRALFESLQEVFFRTDIEGNIILVSPSIVQLLGYTQEEACRLNIGKDIFAHPEQWQEFVNFIQENRYLEAFEVLLRRWDGSVVWGSTASQWYTDKSGHILGVEGIIRDITWRKQVEENLKKNSEFLETLLDTIPGPVFYKDAQGMYQGCNEAFATQVLGTSKERIIGASVFDLADLIPPHLAQMYHEHDRQLFHNAGTQIYEAPMVGADGQERDFVFYEATFNDLDGHVSGLIGVMLDITERKKHEKLLKLNQERLEALVHLHQMHHSSIEEIAEYTLEKAVDLTGSTVGIINYVSEEDGIIKPSTWSRGVLKPSNTAKPAYFSTKDANIWTEVLHQKSALIINDFLASYHLESGHLEEEIKFKRVLIVPVFDEKRLVLLSAVADKEDAYDETDRDELTLLMDGMWTHIKTQFAAEELRKAKERTEAANVQLRELNASKDTFFSIIAHDLRGPLSSLHELTQHIEENLDTYGMEDLKELIVLQKTSAEVLYNLLENLLTWSRVQRGVIAYQPQPINICWFVARNVELLALPAQKKQITLKNLVKKEIFVYADFNMVDTVVRNLVANAIKFTHPGGSVTISAEQKEPFVEIAVADTGIGIEQEHLPDLFRIDVRYRRMGTALEEGTGLGLILCKEFIEKHGCEIRVESQVDKGTTFHFTLPTVTGQDLEPPNEFISP